MTQNNRKPNISRPRQPGNYANYSGYSNNSMKNSRISMANAGVMSRTGVKDAGRYNERLRQGKKYPNRRKVIITGQELTTPLTRKRTVRQTASVAAEKVRIKEKTVAAEIKKFPISAIFCVFIASIVLLGLICSYIVLNEQNIEINGLNDGISNEIKREKIIDYQFDSKNDLAGILDYAVTKLGMVNEDLLQKHYISGSLNDKVEVIAEHSDAFINLPGMMSAIFGN